MVATAGIVPLIVALPWPIIGRLRGVMAREPRRRGLLVRGPLWLRVLFWLSLAYLLFELIVVLGFMQGGVARETLPAGGVLESHGQIIQQLSPAALAFYQRQQVLLLPAVCLFAYAFVLLGYGTVLDTYRPEAPTAG